MRPELFTIGPVTLHSFGLMMALAFVTAGVVAAWRFKRAGIDPDMAYGLLIAAIVGGIVGAKVHYLLVHPDEWRTAAFSGSGLIWYGGMLGGGLAVWLVAHFSLVRTALLADAIAPGLAAAYAVGRVGCLLNGDDYGVPSGLPWAMSFPKGSPPTTQLVHPTQIYEILGSLVILALLLWVLEPRLRNAGSLFWSYLGLAGIERFLVEFVRTNTPVALGLTQAQWMSVGLMVAGALGVWWVESRGAPAGVIGTAAVVASPPRSAKKTRVRAGDSEGGGQGPAGGKGSDAPRRRRSG